MMDEATKQAYERAAVSLEKHEKFGDIFPRSVRDIATSAFLLAQRKLDTDSKVIGDVMKTDDEAARLLRECVARNEELPK